MMKMNQSRHGPLMLGLVASATMAGHVRATSVLPAVDLTTGAVATESSNPYGFPPERVIDGVTTGRNPDFNHTNNGPEEWLRIDLTNATPADHLRIINRADCCSDRLNGTIVRAFTGLRPSEDCRVKSAISWKWQCVKPPDTLTIFPALGRPVLRPQIHGTEHSRPGGAGLLASRQQNLLRPA
jgi:hypothetical protein